MSSVPQLAANTKAVSTGWSRAVELSERQSKDNFRIPIKTADRYVKNGSSTILSGAVVKNGHKTAGVKVRLFMKIPGGTFRATSHVLTTNSAGRFNFRVKPHTGRDYQVRGAGVSSVTARVGVRATAKARQDTQARAGLAWEMVGSTSPKLVGTRVLAQRWTGKKWTDVGQSRVSSSGRYVVKVPSGTADTRYYRAAVIAKKAFIGPGYSKRIAVKTSIRPATSATVEVQAGEFFIGDEVTLTSKTTTRLAGKPVRVQRLTASQGWVNTGTGEIDSAGRIRASATFDTAGTKKVRITLPGVSGIYAKGYTAAAEVVVSPPVPTCYQDPTLCTYEVLDGPSSDLVVLANAERAAANPARIAAGKAPLDPFQSFPTTELYQAAVDCAVQNLMTPGMELHHCTGENLFSGNTRDSADPVYITKAWMDSPGHRAAILDSFTVYAASAVVKRSDGLVVAALASN
ncbi:hypothetical protein D1871_04640 [Nakamurella silvestris]|nr:hypothetical protein D1871_04640 [Nakamurella silvestris]